MPTASPGQPVPIDPAVADFADGPPAGNPWVGGVQPHEGVSLCAYRPQWPARFQQLAETIRTALGPAALHVEHVGSTAVPGLVAKDVIDIDLTVADPSQESSYVPELEAVGYVLRVREPWWHEHRMLRLDDPQVNLHVFGPNSPELVRHRLFRDWLRTHPSDCDLYAHAKRMAEAAACPTVEEYNQIKQPAIREIYRKIFDANAIASAGAN